jgi:hypothetical protein
MLFAVRIRRKRNRCFSDDVLISSEPDLKHGVFIFTNAIRKPF